MDTTKENLRPNPREKANFLSSLLFTYTFDMFKQGWKKDLQVEDLYKPINNDKSQWLGDRLERSWVKQLEYAKRKNKKPSFLKTLIWTFWPEYIYLGVILFVMEVLVRVAQPLMLGKLLEHFHPNSDVSETDAYWYAGAIVVLNFISVLLMNQYLIGAFHYGMRVRAACCAVIYRKALRLSRTAMVDTAAGKIVNLISNDVSRFDLVSILIHYMWVAPISALVVTYFLWNGARLAGIIGMVPMFLVVPLQSYTGKLAAVYRKGIAQKTDERVRLMDEIISGIQVIKMYAWEKPFEKVIRYARKAELRVVAKSSYVRGLYMTFNLFTTRVALFCALITMAFLNEEITAAKVFVFMSFLNILAQSMSSMFVRGVSEVTEVLVSIRRIQGFMTNDEFVQLQNAAIRSGEKSDEIPKDKPTSGGSDVIFAMKDVCAKWHINQEDNTLYNINMHINSPQLVGIIGPVASGKSSLLQTILGELNIVSGNMIINGNLSYASQDAWVFAASVRQNILFGQSYDKKRYHQVVGVCALEQDFAQFPDGDLTIVGDRGASLSGGQKARINLARAIYRNADIYLLDDPLSAVDIHVGKHLYDQCINGYLRNKVRILVTHQVYHLKNAGEIIIFNNGRIEDRGTFQKLSDSTSTYAHLLTSEPEEPPKEEPPPKPKSVSRSTSVRPTSISDATSKASQETNGTLIPEDNRANQEQPAKERIQGSLFFKYLSVGGNKFFEFFVLSLYLLAQIAASGVDYFVSFWTNIEERRSAATPAPGNSTNSTATPPPRDTDFSRETCINIYGAIIASLFVLALARSMLFYKLAMISSQKLHDNLFRWVINASMRFFDTTPSGQILNRFAKDMGCIDELLPKAILDAGQSILILMGSLLLVGVVSPYFFILVAIISILFYILRVIFLKTSLPLKRVEGMMRSPVFSHMNATLQGLTTIRAFQCQEILTKDFDKHQDYHTGAWYMYIIASAAFAFYLDAIVFVMIALITFSFLAFGNDLGLKGGQIGLAITQCSTLTGLIQWGMRQSADVSNQLMSVERVLEYEQLPAEKQPAKPKTPPKEWPDQGQILFKDMGLKYDEEGALVLQNLNLTILPSEKIGIVGRTGAGKSSIISALFRLAPIEGEINIDRIDTKELQLQVLRSKISIIPQDPVLFSGTLRYNLDPFDEYADDVLYQALEAVELKDPNNVYNRLENRVNDKGSNYSVGQRQLICLARAIVRRNKILMLDEATANVDPQTDELIQKTIRTKFAACTVLTVAHRLNTIMDSDKILVMEHGRMVEYDHPHILLQNKEGKLSSMVNETGPAMEEKLKSIAKENYEKVHSSRL